MRLQDQADDDPEAGRELLAFVNEWREQNPQSMPQAAVVSQRAKATGKSTVTQVGRDQITVRPERLS
ncbi:hypothetical protein [Streptomyces californicus]|uniref:hypothetical protein n=1 Tax=Streptomyces californicus TaxID=67351 RepID=UPI0037211E02